MSSHHGHGTPALFRDYRQQLWRQANDGRLVCPDLLPFCE
jgi:hypothetical protein